MPKGLDKAMEVLGIPAHLKPQLEALLENPDEEAVKKFNKKANKTLTLRDVHNLKKQLGLS